MLFITAPKGIMGLLHPERDGSADARLLIDVPGSVMSGSLNIRAVAGIVLGTMKPEFAPRVELKTEITTEPGNPATSRATSDATAIFYKMKK